MKKLMSLLSFIVMLTVISCTEKTTAVKKEVIVVPPAPAVIVIKEEPVKATTIQLDKNGVKVVTKKVDVVIKKQ